MSSNKHRKIKESKEPTVFIPTVGLTIYDVADDPSIPLVITNNPSEAIRLCLSGQPAIAVIGATEKQVAELLRSRSALVSLRNQMN